VNRVFLFYPDVIICLLLRVAQKLKPQKHDESYLTRAGKRKRHSSDDREREGKTLLAKAHRLPKPAVK